MRKLVVIFIFLIAPTLGGLYAQNLKIAADTEFFYCYGGTNFDEARSIKELQGGGYILAGTTSSFGQGNTSVYLIKTDSMGKHLWSAPFGGALNDHAYSVEVTPDSGYFVAGYSNSFNPPNGYDAYYFKTDKNGNLLWQKTVSGYDWDFIYGSAPMPDGGFILCGETYTNSYGGSDAYLIRVKKNGDTLWVKHYGGLFDEKFNSVCVINNKIYAVGKNATRATDTVADGWIMKLDTNGVLLKDTFITGQQHYEEILNGITPYGNAMFHLAGQTNLIDSSSTTSILARMDTSLNLVWMKYTYFTAPGNILIFDKVINISYGSICALGYAIGGLGGTNMFFLGFDAMGNFINDYVHHSGGIYNDYGYDGIYTSSGRVIGVGSTTSFCSGLEDIFLVRFNSDSILNGSISNHTKIKCFTDTLFLWVASIHNYSNDV